MSLITDFPHRIDVQVATPGVDGSGGTTQTWATVYTSVACEITPSGGSVSGRFGGNLLGNEIDVFLITSVITQGCRIVPTLPASTDFYLLTGGIGMCPAEGTIPATYRFHFQRVTTST